MNDIIEYRLQERQEVEHALVQLEDELKPIVFLDAYCDGHLQPENIHAAGFYIGRVWVCDTCNAELYEDEIISRLLDCEEVDYA